MYFAILVYFDFGYVLKATCIFPDGNVSFGGESIFDDQLDFTFKNDTLAQIITIVEASSKFSQSVQFDSTTTLKNPVSKN